MDPGREIKKSRARLFWGQCRTGQAPYGDLKRIETSTLEGAQADLVSTYTYDTAGRMDIVTDPAGLATDYTYREGGRITEVIHPGGATEITDRYLDGRIKSITGTAVVPRHYTYGVNADGTTWTKVNTGTPTSPLWEKTTTDLMGRTVKIENPGYTGTETTRNIYDEQGRLVQTLTTGQADTLYVYDDLGNQIRTEGIRGTPYLSP